MHVEVISALIATVLALVSLVVGAVWALHSSTKQEVAAQLQSQCARMDALANTVEGLRTDLKNTELGMARVIVKLDMLLAKNGEQA